MVNIQKFMQGYFDNRFLVKIQNSLTKEQRNQRKSVVLAVEEESRHQTKIALEREGMGEERYHPRAERKEKQWTWKTCASLEESQGLFHARGVTSVVDHT